MLNATARRRLPFERIWHGDMYRICLRPCSGFGINLLQTLCSRDVRRFLVPGHLASDLGCEVRNRIEVTLEKLRSVDAIIQNRTIYKDLRIQLRALQSRD